MYTIVAAFALRASNGADVNVFLQSPGVKEVVDGLVVMDKDEHRQECRQQGPLAFICHDVPFGWHDLSVEVAGMRAERIPLRVYSGYLSAHVALIPSALEGVLQVKVSGTIQDKQQRELWIKALPIQYGGSAVETSVNRKHFVLAGLDPGSYVFVVIDQHSSQALCVHAVTVGSNVHLSILLHSEGCDVTTANSP